MKHWEPIPCDPNPYEVCPFSGCPWVGPEQPTADEVRKFEDEAGIQRLRTLLDGIPEERIRISATMGWEESIGYEDRYWSGIERGEEPSFDCGIKNAAERYRSWTRMEEQELESPKPYEIQRQLEAVAASARDLKKKLERIHPTLHTSIHDLAETQARASLDDGFSNRTRGLKDWFQFRWISPYDDGLSFAIDDPMACADAPGINLRELESLAQTIDCLAKDAEAKKCAPNGSRGKEWSSQRALIHLVLDALAYHKRPKAHVLPIARIIHEWATSEPTGDEWGVRPLEAISKAAEKRGAARRKICSGLPPAIRPSEWEP